MRRITSLFLLTWLCWLPIIANADELLLLNWPDYLAEELINDYGKKTGNSVKTVIYNTETERNEIIISKAGQKFDLAFMDSRTALLFGQGGLLAPLPPALFENLDPRWKHGCGEWGLPYYWGAVGLIYRKDKFEQPPSSWRELMYPRPEISGHIGMMKENMDSILPALMILGYAPDTDKPEELEKAYQLLLEQKAAVITYEYAPTFYASADYRDELYLAIAFGGDQKVLNDYEKSPVWGYVIPEEGTAVWLDCIGVLQSSTQKTTAIDFLSHISKPENAATNALIMSIASPNIKANESLPDSFLQNVSIYPPADKINAQQRYFQLSKENLRLRSRLMQAVFDHKVQP